MAVFVDGVLILETGFIGTGRVLVGLIEFYRVSLIEGSPQPPLLLALARFVHRVSNLATGFIDFYWLYRVIFWVSSDITEYLASSIWFPGLFFWVSATFLGSNRFQSRTRDLIGIWTLFTWFYQVLLGFTGFYWVLPGFTGFYRVLPGFTGFYFDQCGVGLEFTGCQTFPEP